MSRGLTSSKYNERVGECAEAVAVLNAQLGRGGTHLRDYAMDDLSACRGAMPDNVFRRARHVIGDNARTQAACGAMRSGDAAVLGALMNEGDASCREDYEITCPELDAMTAIARGIPGCHGARMTGAGFGGCTVNLVETDALDRFGERLMAEYLAHTGIEGEMIVSSPAEGAGLAE